VVLSPLRRLRFLWDQCDGARASRFSAGLGDGGSPNTLVGAHKEWGGSYQVQV